MVTLIEVKTDGLAKLAETFGNWTGLNARGKKLMADAEAYAVVRNVEAQNEATLAKIEGEERIAQYIYARESRKMSNLQQIVNQAKTQFTEGEQVSPEPVNEDWQNRFFSIAEDISDEEMQKLWANILAGEVKRPKSFSLRTLDVLRNLSKEEAELFTQANQFYLANNYICTEPFALELLQYLKLSDAGLINNETLFKTWQINKHDKLLVYYRDDIFLNLYNDTDQDITIQIYVKRLTLAGVELRKLCGPNSTDIFLPKLAAKIISRGIRLTTQHYTEVGDKGAFSQEVQLYL